LTFERQGIALAPLPLQHREGTVFDFVGFRLHPPASGVDESHKMDQTCPCPHRGGSRSIPGKNNLDQAMNPSRELGDAGATAGLVYRRWNRTGF